MTAAPALAGLTVWMISIPTGNVTELTELTLLDRKTDSTCAQAAQGGWETPK